MGFFKDVRTLNKQGREMQRNMDVGAMTSGAMAQMQAATAWMQQQTAATARSVAVASGGADAVATVAAVRQTGTVIGFAPVLSIDLLVIRDGLPMPVTVEQPVEQIHLVRAQPGQRLRVKVDPRDRSAVWIDWVSAA